MNELFIPGGMTVCADVWTIHYSKELWGDDVEEFRPERYFTGDFRKKPPPGLEFAFFRAGLHPQTPGGFAATAKLGAPPPDPLS